MSTESPLTATYRVANVLLPADPDEMSPLDRMIHDRRIAQAKRERKYAAWLERDRRMRAWLDELLGAVR